MKTTTQSQNIILTMAANPSTVFTAADIMDKLNIPPGSAGTLLSDLAEVGRIDKVGRGHYQAGTRTFEEAVELLTAHNPAQYQMAAAAPGRVPARVSGGGSYSQTPTSLRRSRSEPTHVQLHRKSTQPQPGTTASSTTLKAQK